MSPATLTPRAANFFQLSLGLPLIALRYLRHKFLKRLQHSLLLALTQAIDALMVVLNGFPDNLAFRFGKPRRGVIQAPDGRLVERKGHLGCCHTKTILPYQGNFFIDADPVLTKAIDLLGEPPLLHPLDRPSQQQDCLNANAGDAKHEHAGNYFIKQT